MGIAVCFQLVLEPWYLLVNISLAAAGGKDKPHYLNIMQHETWKDGVLLLLGICAQDLPADMFVKEKVCGPLTI